MKEYLKDILETESEGDALGKKADKHDIGEEGGNSCIITILTQNTSENMNAIVCIC